MSEGLGSKPFLGWVAIWVLFSESVTILKLYIIFTLMMLSLFIALLLLVNDMYRILFNHHLN